MNLYELKQKENSNKPETACVGALLRLKIAKVLQSVKDSFPNELKDLFEGDALISNLRVTLDKTQFTSDITSKIRIQRNILFISEKTNNIVQFSMPNGTYQDFVELLKTYIGQIVWIENLVQKLLTL